MQTATEKEGVEQNKYQICPNRTIGTMTQNMAWSWMLE